MQISSDKNLLQKVTYLIGSADTVEKTFCAPAMIPFDGRIIDFLNDVSREIMNDRRSRAYSDVITFAFWIRKGSTVKLKERFEFKDNAFHIGKGVAFHIAPSNVPVNFAYSLVAGLLNGNANIVRVPSKDFPQVAILADAFNKALVEHEDMKPYVICVRYERDKKINDMFSSVADLRVVWGGDKTIEELRKSPLPPRSGEITFADRYSIAVIDSDKYSDIADKRKVAEDFYNDTFFSDQNACTSPRIIVWTGNQTETAKKEFWEEAHKVAEEKYAFQPIQSVNKLTQCFKASTVLEGMKVVPRKDNLIVRVAVTEITDTVKDFFDNSGYFYEFDCEDISMIKSVCDDKRCQTIAYIGGKDTVMPLLRAGVKGVDRVVPIGKTMDFDLIWDGYNLSALMTRTVVIL